MKIIIICISISMILASCRVYSPCNNWKEGKKEGLWFEQDSVGNVKILEYDNGIPSIQSEYVDVENKSITHLGGKTKQKTKLNCRTTDGRKSGLWIELDTLYVDYKEIGIDYMCMIPTLSFARYRKDKRYGRFMNFYYNGCYIKEYGCCFNNKKIGIYRYYFRNNMPSNIILYGINERVIFRKRFELIF